MSWRVRIKTYPAELQPGWYCEIEGVSGDVQIHSRESECAAVVEAIATYRDLIAVAHARRRRGKR